jgi:ribosomal protein S27E
VSKAPTPAQVQLSCPNCGFTWNLIEVTRVEAVTPISVSEDGSIRRRGETKIEWDREDRTAFIGVYCGECEAGPLNYEDLA